MANPIHHMASLSLSHPTWNYRGPDHHPLEMTWPWKKGLQGKVSIDYLLAYSLPEPRCFLFSCLPYHVIGAGT